jgi:hypothetical protein
MRPIDLDDAGFRGQEQKRAPLGTLYLLLAGLEERTSNHLLEELAQWNELLNRSELALD